MPLTKLKLNVASKQASQRLDETLSSWLTERLQRAVSKAKARKLIMAGAVLVDGRRVRLASQSLSSSSTIEAAVDIAKLFNDATSRDKSFELTTQHVLFEDQDLIVVDKPAGLPAHPTVDQTRDNLFDAVGRFLAKRDKDSEPYIGIHHRLDRDTSGVVLFTKSQRINAAVAEIFENHRVTKIYQALSSVPRSPARRSKFRQAWTIKNRLDRIGSRSKRAKYGAVLVNGDLAETSFRVLRTYARGVWIEAIPKTGRTHQIRVHLSEYGLPILGDDLYGEEVPAFVPRLMLHATQLTLPHPISGREISIKSSLPADFQDCLRRLMKQERYTLER